MGISYEEKFYKITKRYRNKRCRIEPKQPLKPGQRGRTHRRKPRGTRKPYNMGLRQYKRYVWDKFAVRIVKVVRVEQ